MPPKPAQPNRLRQSVPPNKLRGFDTPGSWLANGVTDGARSRRGAPAAPRSRARSRAAADPRLVGRIGLLVAAAGVLPFLNAELRWQEVGLGMMCVGVGMALLAATPAVIRSRARSARGATPGAAAVLVRAPHLGAVPLIGGGLLLAGMFLLLDAVATA